MKRILFLHAFILIVFLFAFTSCSKKAIIVVDNIETLGDFSFFRGIEPDMYYDDLVAVVGEPNDYIDKKSLDDEDHNPIYYFKERKVMCYWSGDKADEMGNVVYTPYLNIHIRIDDIIKCPLNDYGITSDTERVHIYEGDTLYYIIELDNLEVKEVCFLLYKKN